ncbi:MAG: hypothetical protein ACE5NC_06740 [Anaerolineae bacterium]
MEQAGTLLRLINRRFRDLSWVAVGVLLDTGLLKARFLKWRREFPLNPWLLSKLAIVDGPH